MNINIQKYKNKTYADTQKHTKYEDYSLCNYLSV